MLASLNGTSLAGACVTLTSGCSLQSIVVKAHSVQHTSIVWLMCACISWVGCNMTWVGPLHHTLAQTRTGARNHYELPDTLML